MKRTEIELAFRQAPPRPARSGVDAPRSGAGTEFTPAAVLCPIVERRSGLFVHLVRRSETLRRHAGQISFPGGRIERDDRNSLAAALREAKEEIGLDAALVEPIGTLPLYRTGTGYEIRPHVGFVRADFVARPDGSEIVAAFEAPLSYLLDPRNRRIERRRIEGRLRSYYAITWEEHTIWGATAAMLKAFSDRVSV